MPRILVLLVCASFLSWNTAAAQPVMEKLGRGLVVVRTADTAAYVGWRLLATEPSSVGFNVYRAAGGGRPRRLNTAPLTKTTDFVDTTLDPSVVNTYTVRAVAGRQELEPSAPFVLPIGTAVQQFLAVPLQRPPGGEVPGPSGAVTAYTYNANDASAGDLDGDGEYEIVLKWDPSSASLIRLLTAEGAAANNGSKATPALSADLLGDWREEVIWRSADNMSLRIYTTTIPAVNRLHTLMHDRTYRLATAWQNVGYNQPPHPGFFLGDGMKAPPPRIGLPK